jgi:hypothetical protein
MKIAGLSAFLVEAKRNTYAAQRGRVPSSRPESHDFAYEKGKFRYLDSYVGEIRFSGEEIVWYDSKPVWSMNYYGRLLGPEPGPGFGDFLKRALLLVSKTKPFRGPDLYEEGEYRFVQTFEGGVETLSGIEDFSGREEILYRDVAVYRLWFHGGILA